MIPEERKYRQVTSRFKPYINKRHVAKTLLTTSGGIGVTLAGSNYLVNKARFEAGKREFRKMGYSRREIREADRLRKVGYIHTGYHTALLAGTTSIFAKTAAKEIRRVGNKLDGNFVGKRSMGSRRNAFIKLGVTGAAMALSLNSTRNFQNTRLDIMQGELKRNNPWVRQTRVLSNPANVLPRMKKTPEPTMSRAQAARKAALARWSQWRSGNKPRK